MQNLLQWIGSYLWGIKLAEYPSAVSGTLELWLINGRKVVHAPHVNYSFHSLHRVFQRAFRSAVLKKNPPQKVLVLGFGAGSVAHILHTEYGFDCSITGVDLDPVMLRLAQEEFNQTPSPRLRLFAADAVAFVATDTGTYDLIVVDVFVDELVPEAVTAPSFLAQTLQRLAPGGRFFLNLITGTRQGQQQLQGVKEILRDKPIQVLYPVDGNAVVYFVNGTR